jgi:hypothetical protein
MGARAGLAAVIPLVLVVLFTAWFAATGQLGSAAFMAAVGAAVFVPPAVRLRRQPRRVLLDARGVTFDGPRWRRSVAWAELDEVASYRGGRARLRLAWRLRDGGEITSRTPDGTLHAMLQEIGRQAPHVRISV